MASPGTRKDRISLVCFTSGPGHVRCKTHQAELLRSSETFGILAFAWTLGILGFTRKFFHASERGEYFRSGIRVSSPDLFWQVKVVQTQVMEAMFVAEMFSLCGLRLSSVPNSIQKSFHKRSWYASRNIGISAMDTSITLGTCSRLDKGKPVYFVSLGCCTLCEKNYRLNECSSSQQEKDSSLSAEQEGSSVSQRWTKYSAVFAPSQENGPDFQPLEDLVECWSKNLRQMVGPKEFSRITKSEVAATVCVWASGDPLPLSGLTKICALPEGPNWKNYWRPVHSSVWAFSVNMHFWSG